MVSHHVFSQLVLLALLWLFVILHLSWPKRPVTTPAVPALPEPLTPKRPRSNERSCTCPLRINTAGSLTNRQKDKKVYTSGLSWPPSGPLPPGDALDAGRVDARRRLRPPPLAASHHSACSHSCWLRPRRHAEHQHLTQAPHPIRHPRRHRRRLGTPLLGRARPIGRLGLRQRLA